jgi:hypothetical protein
MTTDERLAKVAEVLHHEGGPAEDGWSLTPETCGTCARSLRLAQALAPLLAEFAAQDRAAGWDEATALLTTITPISHTRRDETPRRWTLRGLSRTRPERGGEGHRDGTGAQRGDSAKGEL